MVRRDGEHLMRLDDSPVFRREIIPWYDATITCILTLVLMDGVFLFSATGASVVREAPAYHADLWVPAILMATSGAVIVTISLRLIRRLLRHWREEEELEGG